MCLIRLFRTQINPNQPFQTKVTLIRLSRHRGSLIRLFRTKTFWSDNFQTIVQTQIHTIALTLIRLWSDSIALEEVMIRPSCAQSIYGQTQLRLQPFMIRLKCAQNRFWWDSSALEKVWSENDLLMKKSDNFSIKYSFHKNWCLLFIIYLRETIIKLLLKKTKPNCWEQILFSEPFSVYFWHNGWVETAFHKKHRGLQSIKVSS